jgi:benzoyl-CoA reductase/2-hydroxyglutaryl-CoA dehydratase subunit BcrC/BadD/HgdB
MSAKTIKYKIKSKENFSLQLKKELFMRPEIKEYNYDWLMGNTFKTAAGLSACTPKEINHTYKYVPYFKNVVTTLLDDDPGIQTTKMLSQYYKNILTARAQGKKVCATTFCNSPVVLYAMDIVPVTLEVLTALGGLAWKRGMFDYMDYCCETGMPETSCSSQRGAQGAFLAGLCEEIDFVICDTPGVCDTNANAFAYLAEYLDKPYYQLNYPSTIGDERSQKYHVDDYKEMIRFVEQHSGKKMDYDRLAEVLAEVDKQDALLADIEDMLMLRPTPIKPVYSLYLYTGRFCLSGHPEFTKLLESVVKTAKAKVAAGISGLRDGEEKLRVFLSYIDHYTADINFFNYMDERGIAHVGSILSKNYKEGSGYTDDLPGNAYAVDTSSPEAMLDTVAQMNARLPMVRSIRGPYDGTGMWLDETLICAKMYQADCVIYNGTPGCRNTWGMLKPFARDIEKHGYPCHIMNDDAFDDRVESWEATKERLDEFFQIRGLL